VGVEAVVCASLHEASWLERNLLERSLPRWNRTRGGQEVPCWLVLDDGPRRPGLVLVWSEPDAPAFGPYLAALDWLIAPQRVTGCTPADLAVHGWSDGVLFSLTASDGRLDGWSVTTVDADAAASKLQRTPPHWRDFAARNAELAAALRRALGPR